MKQHPWYLTLSLIASGALLVSITIGQDAPKAPQANPPTGDAKVEDGIQIENRGPVHEAFANPGAPVRGGKDGNVADKAPPPPVPELPPDEKPSGNNVRWIAGYWQWDIEKKDFIWVSGFWRNTPPGRDWQPGEWKVENGVHRYIPGFWKPSDNQGLRQNLPEPPKTVENGPNVPAPHSDALWIPGHWVYRDDNYVWRPGYWGEVEEDLVWTPGQYNYTGNGYCWVPGYWDYNLEDRGLLYAPVYFTRPLWLSAGWRFCPSFGINVGFGGGWAWGYGGFYDSLFIGPGYGSFWFGNYFGAGYWGCGYRPWCWNGFGGRCSPVYNHYCWLNRGNNNWNRCNQQNYAARNLGVIPGPGRNVNRNGGVNTAGNINPRTLNNATTLANRLGGEKAGKQLADRVARGQEIQKVNQSLKQAGSSTVVQPAKQVLNQQNVVKSLPAPTNNRTTQSAGSISRTTAGDLGSTLRSATRNSSTSDAARGSTTLNRGASGADSALRQQLNSAIRNAPASGNRSSDGIAGSARSLSGSSSSRSLGSASSSRSFDSMSGARSGSSGSMSRSGSLPGGTSGRSSFSPPSGGSSRGSFSGGSMGGSRGGAAGGSFGGSRGGGSGGGGARGGKR